MKTVLDAKNSKSPSFIAADWEAVTTPKERVFLFPGAEPPKNSTEGTEWCEITHCDGCSRRIHGVVRKCTHCFDYDLCQKCYTTISKTHFNGEHQFSMETMQR